jgi:hypothetical protein
MHNREGKNADSREITLRDGLVLVPIAAVIVFLAVYPQVALHKSESSVRGSVASVQLFSTCGEPPECAHFSAHAGRVTDLDTVFNAIPAHDRTVEGTASQ